MKPTVFYVEKSYQPELHQYILKHIPRMSFWYDWYGCQLVYLPMYQSNENRYETVKDYLLHEFPVLNKPEFERVLNTLSEPAHMVINRMMAEQHLDIDNSKASLLFTNDELQQTDKPFKVLATYRDGETPEQFFTDGFKALYFNRFQDRLDHPPYNDRFAAKDVSFNPPVNKLSNFADEDFDRELKSKKAHLSLKGLYNKTPEHDVPSEIEHPNEEIIPVLSNELKQKLTDFQKIAGNENMVDLLVHVLNNMQTYIEYDSQDILKMLETSWKDFGRGKNPSRLLINKQCRIFLTDFGNLEIEMRPLPKTLFLFYLNRPDGLRLVDLVDHKEELTRIYGKISNSSNMDSIMDRISDLVDVSKNSIHEKCSRVKEAFYEKMSPNMAAHYIIDGGRTEVKSIKLDRSLVTFEL